MGDAAPPHVSPLAFLPASRCVLALVGIYGVISYNGLRRTREIGVRLALGARRGQIVSLILGQGAVCSRSASASAFTAAFALSRLIRSLLFDVSASDPGIFFSVSLLLGFAAVIACWIPAHALRGSTQ